jgi:purine-nucleoside/S-methyl-5'-thioadenosine phosphorylase / adenosine deaminase
MTLRQDLDRRGLDWIVPDWPAPPNVRALMTTRNGGFSKGACATLNLARNGADDPEAVARNQRLLEEVIGVAPAWLSQMHGTAVADVDRSEGVTAADAAVASHAGRAVAVRVADCLPVLFCDRAGTRIGAAHAGWRGLAAGVLEQTVAAMRVEPRELIAWMGPAIGPDAFEVGDDVRDVFVGVDAAATAAFRPYPARPGKWLADLFELGAMRLRACGVATIAGGGVCTVSNPDRFFSYRRDRSPGRMAAMVWLL